MTILFLDLEQTVIEEFVADFCLINITKIRRFIKNNNITNVVIWSFAVWKMDNPVQVISALEQTLCMQNIDVICADTAIKTVFPGASMKTALDISEILLTQTKTGLLWEFLLAKQNTGFNILLDDTVRHLELRTFPPTLSLLSMNIHNI